MIIAKFETNRQPPPHGGGEGHGRDLSTIGPVTSPIQGCLASGYPFVFGFTVYESFEGDPVTRTGHVPMPESGEGVVGGHAVSPSATISGAAGSFAGTVGEQAGPCAATLPSP